MYVPVCMCTVQYSTVVPGTSTTSTKLGEQQVETTGAHHQHNITYMCTTHIHGIHLFMHAMSRTVRVPHPIKQKTQILFVSRDVKTQNSNVQCYTT